MQVAVRAAIALLCAGGVVASVISYRSQKSFDQGFERMVAYRLDDRTRELLEDARPLNPDTRIDLGVALVDEREGRDPLPRIRSALRREPDNVGLVANYRFLLEQVGRPAEAERAYERAHELDPHRFPLP